MILRKTLTDKLFESLHNENDTNETGKCLLSEPGEVPDNGGAIKSSDNDTEECRPQSNPKPHSKIEDVILPEKYNNQFF